jgi:hypothetical protein
MAPFLSIDSILSLDSFAISFTIPTATPETPTIIKSVLVYMISSTKFIDILLLFDGYYQPYNAYRILNNSLKNIINNPITPIKCNKFLLLI